MNTIYNILISLLSVDTICKLIARGIAKILETASKKGGDAWCKAKEIIKKIHLWCGLFLEVYEDDNLTEEEESKIADAIKNQTKIEKISDILKENE
jgi:Na+/phosphate symporter